jgi:hypothetical protein
MGMPEAALLMIESMSGTCSQTGGPYEVRRIIGGSDTGMLQTGAEIETAWNGCEAVETLGGQITGSDCTIQPVRTRIPKGVTVVGMRGGPNGNWWFNNANEYCVECCADEGVGEELIGTDINVVGDDTPTGYDPGYASIYKEMTK